MRQSLFALAALAATALAAPVQEIQERDNIVWIKKYTTVTAGQPAAATPAPAAQPIVYVKAAVDTSSSASTDTAASDSTSDESNDSDSLTAPTNGDYADLVIYHHNIHRRNHSVSDLTWSDALAATAQKTASTCVYAHDTQTDSSQGAYGQNIAAGVPAANVGRVISDMFYNGEVELFAGYYGQASPPMGSFSSWGHFSQIVWKGTTEVGCATQSCGSLANTGSGVPGHFTVCNYRTPGNYAGQYAENILKPLGHPTVVDSAAKSY